MATDFYSFSVFFENAMEKYGFAINSESVMSFQTGLIKFELLVTNYNKEKISFGFFMFCRNTGNKQGNGAQQYKNRTRNVLSCQCVTDIFDNTSFHSSRKGAV